MIGLTKDLSNEVNRLIDENKKLLHLLESNEEIIRTQNEIIQRDKELIQTNEEINQLYKEHIQMDKELIRTQNEINQLYKEYILQMKKNINSLTK